MHPLTCVFCKFWYFESGSPHYSDLTPGYDAHIGCSKDYWELDQSFDSEEDYRRKMLSAGSCADFEMVDGLGEVK